MYLPPQKETPIYFVRDILKNWKKVRTHKFQIYIYPLFTNEVKVRTVPHINGLRVDYMLFFIENKCPDGIDYLSDYYKRRSISRDWLGNLCNSPNDEEFKEFINHAIQEREKFIIKKKSLEMNAEFRIVKTI